MKKRARKEANILIDGTDALLINCYVALVKI
jgi:hypothetical protein